MGTFKAIHNSVHSREYKIFQQELRIAREQQGISQNELARRLKTTQGYISKCESGDLRLDVAQIRAFCAALDVSFIDFMRQYDAAVLRATKK
jgi:transcriptional regulator with XRE-family HTH domain